MANQLFSKALVSAKWLAEVIGARRVGPGLRVLDASWYPPGERDARQEYLERHIPGASFFDIEVCKDQASPYEVMLPSEQLFGDYVGSLGVGNNTHVVVYDGDQVGSSFAPRAWWMFRAFGHRQVSVLNGGFRNWVREGRPVTAEASRPEPTQFKAKLDGRLVKSFEEMLENLQTKRFQVVDSRSEGRYRGTVQGQGFRHGHFTGTINIPLLNFFTDSGHQKQAEELQRLFLEKKVDLTQPLVATCHRGVTACSVALAAHTLGKEDVAVYDGSWSEWVTRANPEDIISEGTRNSG
ncbi:thiosulfate sulfurtransferase-like [Lissotriton helveticus]